MLDKHTLLLYLPAMLAITLAPGADTLFVVASALRGGARGGVLAALGIISGGTVHIGFAIVGLSALILKSAIAFAALKYAGAAYLMYLGVRTLTAKAAIQSAQVPERGDLFAGVVFRQGFVTNVLNPKVALFVLAFFPQFVSPARGPVWSQLLELGVLWYAAGFIWLGFVGTLVGRAKRSAAPPPFVRSAFKYVTGCIFIALGIRVALPE